MAALDAITVSTSEYRPCLVDGEKALFHRWVDVSEIIPPSLMVGGHCGGVVKDTLGMVETENGQVKTVKPERIKFTDNKISEYCFK